MFSNLFDDKKDSQLDLGPEAISLDFLRAVYRDPTQALTTRMRAAMACLPFEVPKLAVTAVVTNNDIATLLDQRIERFQKMKLIEAKRTNEDGGSVDARLPPPVPDRRFRRI
jgi:hypothetical protein